MRHRQQELTGAKGEAADPWSHRKGTQSAHELGSPGWPRTRVCAHIPVGLQQMSSAQPAARAMSQGSGHNGKCGLSRDGDAASSGMGTQQDGALRLRSFQHHEQNLPCGWARGEKRGRGGSRCAACSFPPGPGTGPGLGPHTARATPAASPCPHLPSSHGGFLPYAAFLLKKKKKCINQPRSERGIKKKASCRIRAGAGCRARVGAGGSWGTESERGWEQDPRM